MTGAGIDRIQFLFESLDDTSAGKKGHEKTLPREYYNRYVSFLDG